MSTSQKATEMIDYRSEQWRAIDDFYEVSNFGRVAEIGGRLLNRRMKILGISLYAYSHLGELSSRCTGWLQWHFLYLIRTHCRAAIHVNGNPTDNHPVNLKWCTSKTDLYTFAPFKTQCFQS